MFWDVGVLKAVEFFINLSYKWFALLTKALSRRPCLTRARMLVAIARRSEFAS